jgi:hypothetical protein
MRTTLTLPRLRPVGLLVALAAVLVTPESAAQADSPSLRPCSGLPELPAARCGSVRVPLDRANPSLGTTDVAFALVPRRDASRPSLGTILYTRAARELPRSPPMGRPSRIRSHPFANAASCFSSIRAGRAAPSRSTALRSRM